MYGIIERETGHAGTSGDDAADDIFFDATIEKRDVCRAIWRRNMEWCLCGNFFDKIDTGWIVVSLVFVRVVRFSDSDFAERRAWNSRDLSAW